MERQRRERRYILPDEPAIIVHPNWAAKSGKFDCSIMSLSVLLDYRLEDNKEHSFEVIALPEFVLNLECPPECLVLQLNGTQSAPFLFSI